MSLNFRELLAQFVQEEPAIWDTRCNDYHLKMKRDDAWGRVLKKFLARKIICDCTYRLTGWPARHRCSF
ncbi:unnamed protein product [Cylicocyclus nassatus]|uniref:MADF domain-containing protein n=1 Tax=Cylicocyclus nassatus TaxID=53992 RepID=A0AA36H243_CYLNA|nr:unnamed protein product [Cylicocyclus nassatus]